MMAKLALPFLVLLISCYVGEAIASASNASNVIVIYNPTKEKIHARVLDMSSRTGSVDYPVAADGTIEISFERQKHYALFFPASCSEYMEGHLRDCLSGNCPDTGCTVMDPPVAVTTIYYNNGNFTTSTALGYNFGIRGDFQCDCSCPSISCIIPLNKCPSSKILEDAGSAVACMGGEGVPSCDDDATAPASTSCFDDAIMKFTVSSLPKE